VIRLRHVSLALLAVLTALLMGGGSAHAHDLERTQVSLTFEPDGTFVLDVANDPNWLLLRLEDFVGDYPNLPPASTSSAPVSEADRDARLRTLAPTFIDRVVMWVNGREIRPTSVEYVAPRPIRSDDNAMPLGVYRMGGRLPLDARTLQWYYGIVVDPYPFVIHRADGQSITETVFGRAWSRQLDLTGQFRAQTTSAVARKYFGRGLAAILPRNIEQILFALGIVLLAAPARSVLAQFAVFTLGSSFAVALRVLDIIRLSPTAAEALAAASLAYVAIENIAARGVGPRRLAMLALFGALHGVALGAVLLAAAPPSANLAATIVSFDVGVAAAQLALAALAGLSIVGYRKRSWYHQRIVVPVSLGLATVGVYWMLVQTIG